jgi:hypothetical protein
LQAEIQSSALKSGAKLKTSEHAGICLHRKTWLSVVIFLLLLMQFAMHAWHIWHPRNPRPLTIFNAVMYLFALTGFFVLLSVIQCKLERVLVIFVIISTVTQGVVGFMFPGTIPIGGSVTLAALWLVCTLVALRALSAGHCSFPQDAQHKKTLSHSRDS